MTQQPHNEIGPDAPPNQPAWLGLPDNTVSHPQQDPTSCPASAGQLGAWLTWHWFEIASVVLPLALAVTVSAWFAAVAAVFAASWVTNEVRVRQRNRAIQPGSPRSLLPGTNTTTDPEGPDDDD